MKPDPNPNDRIRHRRAARNTARRLAVLVACGCIAATAAFEADARQQYRMKKLAGMGGAVGINSAGVVAGFWVVDGRTVPAIWRNGMSTTIDVQLPGRTANNPRLLAINDNGWVLGTAETTLDQNNRREFPFIWVAGETRALDCPLDHCRGTSIDDAGNVAGYAWLNGDFNNSAVGMVWRDRVPQTFSSLPGGVPSTSVGTTPNGILFGWGRGGNAFHWRDGVTTPMPLLGADSAFWQGNYFAAKPRGVAGNRRGHFVGAVDHLDSTVAGFEAFSYFWADGGYTRIASFPTSEIYGSTSVYSVPIAINDLDQVVGTVCVNWNEPVANRYCVDGLLWTPDGGSVNGKKLISRNDPLKERYSSLQLAGINNASQIVGTGSFWEFGSSYSAAVMLVPTPSDNDLLVDFGPQYGIWQRRNDRNWVGVHSVSAQHVASGDLDDDGRADALIDFGPPYGIWARRNGTTWEGIHEASAQQIVATDLDDNGKTDFVINFGSQYGLWAYMNDGTWKGLHEVAPRQVISANLDADPRRDLVVDFGPQFGIWQYMNNSTWVALHGLSAKNMVAGDLDRDGIDDLVIDFGPGTGIWIRKNQSSWVPLHGGESRHMVVGNFDSRRQPDVVIDFGPGYGIWQWQNDERWSPIHATSAKAMTVADVDQSGIDDLVVSFDGPLGLWQWKNGSTWEGLHGVSSQRLIATDFDGQ